MEGHGLSLIEDRQRAQFDFYGAGLALLVDHVVRPAADDATNGEDPLFADVFGLGGQFGVLRGVDKQLGDAFAVAEVDEDQPAQIAAGIDPAAEADRLTDLGCAQLIAVMRACIGHGGSFAL